jgi:hypothetical protein
MGNYGAAFIVVFWGTVDALLQILDNMQRLQGEKCLSRRLWTLVVGLALPLFFKKKILL